MDELGPLGAVGVAVGVMCRNTVSIGWYGLFYDFNQMLELKVKSGPQHIKDFDQQKLESHEIKINQLAMLYLWIRK